MTAWQTLLAAFGGEAVLLVVLGFFARTLIQTWIAKDLKKFEDALAREACAIARYSLAHASGCYIDGG